jgi:signal transduction histidine kinase
MRLTVDDDGPGIPESERERVLMRFVRLDEGRSRDEGGSGLGLAIVDEVVRAHGGSLFIGQAPAGGARIEIVLPAGHG